MGKVYIVSTGEYSDYSICSVFSTKEKAEQYIKHFSNEADYTGYDIEEYTLDPISDDIYMENKLLYFVFMFENGDVSNVFTCSPSYNHAGENEFMFIPNHYKVSEHKNDLMYIRFCVWAKSQEHAVKIANEKRAIILSNGVWGNNEMLNQMVL